MESVATIKKPRFKILAPKPDSTVRDSSNPPRPGSNDGRFTSTYRNGKVELRNLKMCESENLKPLGGYNGKKLQTISGTKRGQEQSLVCHAQKRRKGDRGIFEKCSLVLRKLINHEDAWPFTKPVDPVALKIPDYFSIISHPMDLGTIESRLKRNFYTEAEEFDFDVRLTFSNAMLYNPPYNVYHQMAKKLEELYDVCWRSLGATRNQSKKAKLQSALKDKELSDNVGGDSIRMACADVGLSHSSVRIPSVKVTAVSSKDVPRRMGIKAQEENRIGDNKVSLSCRNSMKTREPRTSAQHKEALHTKSVPVSTLSRKRKTLEKCEVKCRFESPVNNACHESDSGARRLVEEPAYSISQVTSTSCSAAHAEPRTSTQHKEALYTKSVPVSTLSGKRKTLEKCDVKCSSKSPMNNACLESDSGARPLVEEPSYNISQVTSTSYSAAHADCESLSYGSLLSPSKEQRAEMLKKRFAETIFKAQRKNLNVKFDSLKVQQEKERLERIQCEERARIEAEMKASKIKLETELSNRRQQEREAARMALEKMERSVEFVDNTRILRELAKLIGDNSFAGPLSGSGGMYVAASKFANGKLKSPLERLGLFLKDDYASVDDFDELKKFQSGDYEEGELIA